ncbi:uncharacterized protein LOC126852055 [Cataglyphis hispanica]|uniref:uncharacterized protein LOC126852055 n=1 Tax=Cataglyphis hispanica TaxID=1086592 RepID=UPI0021804C7D|nr:uncharacterized protein LOC126852055 [Cataglyphis hispanica]
MIRLHLKKFSLLSLRMCPLNAALKVANLKKIKIGWTLARVELLDNIPVQCFKCWIYGHVRLACSSKEDFSGLCFKCGRKGHLANNCNLPPFVRCVIQKKSCCE